MVVQKKLILRFFFVLEVAVFLGVYFGSSGGLSSLGALKQENSRLAESITRLEGELQKLEQEQKKWDHTSFYKEKWAREQLQMARPDDEVYFLR